jgi:type IV pilus assembly protein PilC
MDFNYICYTEDKKVVKGTISASDEKIAEQILARSGSRVLNLKPVTSFMPNLRKLFPSFYRVGPEVVILFSRQLALLLESGTDIVTSLELLQSQTSDGNLKRVLGEVVSDLRRGDRFSEALSKHPQSFPSIYPRALSVGERTGGLETVLKQMADYMEKRIKAAKNIKSALRYPIIIIVVAIVVVGIIIVFVLPAFASLYSSLGVELPPMTKFLMSMADWIIEYNIYVIGAVLSIVGGLLLYIKTPGGKFQWDRLALRLPLIGRVRRLDELAHCCRSMALLFRAGLPLPEVMSLVIDSSDNSMVKRELTGVRQDMIKGEGLSRPMAKSPLFFPLMVQMVAVGEETGNLDATLLAVAQNFETEAEDKMRTFVGLIQPMVTGIVGAIVAFIALSLVSAMYSIYGQLG